MSKRVTVITPTTGSKYLNQNLQSVSEQTYDNVEHLVVVDGPPYYKSANDILEGYQDKTVMYLQENTGADQYNGHRIYGSMPYLVNSDYVMFLDEDNYIDKKHIETLVEVCETSTWAYSLRKIVDKDGNYVCLDDCENLGKWPTCLSDQELFVDVGAYFLPTTIAIQISPLWYRRARHPDEQPEVDRIIMQTLLAFGWSYDTNGMYTLNYRVGNREDSVKADFFIWGNSVMEKKFKDGYPWRKK
jgi:glycosyltransferase involved in cell wall biosynthesis